MIILNQRTQLPATDSVALAYDERKRSRLKVTLASGAEAGIFLERGDHLHGGDRLIAEDGAAVVEHADRVGIAQRTRVAAIFLELTAGDAWCVPGGVEHGADLLEDSVAIEVWSPVREDLLPRCGTAPRATRPGALLPSRSPPGRGMPTQNGLVTKRASRPPNGATTGSLMTLT